MSDRFDEKAKTIIYDYCRHVGDEINLDDLKEAISTALKDAWNDGVRDAPKAKAMADEIVKTLSGTRAICSRCGGKDQACYDSKNHEADMVAE